MNCSLAVPPTKGVNQTRIYACCCFCCCGAEIGTHTAVVSVVWCGGHVSVSHRGAEAPPLFNHGGVVTGCCCRWDLAARTDSLGVSCRALAALMRAGSLPGHVP
eukprot:TRINITY_DN17592_c0_g1_i1.p3 TRINITY_DN17592_c0_g1~~TRINITY_DN17592_c0_g1_i1.p3  ORF type:complete len:104 (-),score=12.63 TRINITY_DN17592_c0_g1_i1:178-489(-)